MKAKILTKAGSKGEIEIPKFFSGKIREDICQKFFEAQKKIQPYASFIEAGKHHSASGNLSHSRRLWKTAYGKGISRVPRKILWRRGDHFYWVGAEVSGTRGGRQAHPPKIERFLANKKINKKEAILAVQSALASTGNINFLKRRYSSLGEIKLDLPLIINSEILKMKTWEIYEILEKILENAFSIAVKHKKQRAGKGKARGRRYKENAGLLIVIGKNENLKLSGVEVRKLDELEVSDLFPLGRLTIYSEEAIKEINNIGEKK